MFSQSEREEYWSWADDTDLALSNDASDGGDDKYYPPDIQPTTNLMESRSEASTNFLLTTESLFESFQNLSSPIHHVAIINNSKDEPMMVEDALG